MTILTIVVGWVITVFIGLLDLIILWLIIVVKIDLQKLISEPSGDASLSRFQFLVFKFVIAMSLLLLTIKSDPSVFPKIPTEILVLLGISGSSYMISKAIQQVGI